MPTINRRVRNTTLIGRALTTTKIKGKDSIKWHAIRWAAMRVDGGVIRSII